MFGKAVSDFGRSAQAWRLWSFMGYQDVRQRYRNSILGPIWLVANLGVLVLGIGFLYSQLLQTDYREYIPFLTAGLMLWNFFVSTLTEACTAFTSATGILRQIKVPLPVFVLRVLWRNLIILGHSVVVFAIVAVGFGLLERILYLEAAAGLALFMINLGWIMMAVALLAARFRDVTQIVLYGLVFATFVTPVYWLPELIPDRSPYLLNPLAQFLEVARRPLLGEYPTTFNWVFCLVTATIGWIFAYFAYAWKRREVIFWI